MRIYAFLCWLLFPTAAGVVLHTEKVLPRGVVVGGGRSSGGGGVVVIFVFEVMKSRGCWLFF